MKYIFKMLKVLSRQIFKSFIIYDIKLVLSVWTLMVLNFFLFRVYINISLRGT
jgi:hypothetical protein